MSRVFVGTSGWTYDFWRNDFYAGVPRRAWLAHYATQFDAVEVNATFYHALRPAVMQGWYGQTPARFRFCLKGHRWITHVERLRVDAAAIARERDRAAPLRNKLAVVLWQLPHTLGRDDARLRNFARRLRAWPGPRHAIEFRDPSWFDDEVAEYLREHDIAAVQSDAADWPCWNAVTAKFVYVRLHGHAVTYVSGYGPRALARWADRIAAWRAGGRDVFVFFDNTDAGRAPRDARSLAQRCAA
ncbi:MAG: DUF72 domain-containing protein [Gemmatimonadota bacterium]